MFPATRNVLQDSFFAFQRPVGREFPGRRYLGICAFGRRYPATMIRVYVALMAAAQVLYEKYDNLADPWMTLVGYFNSIRELAGTRRLVEDDIRARLRDADQRGLAKRQVRSRLGGTDLAQVRHGHPEDPGAAGIDFRQDAEAHRAARAQRRKKAETRPFDVVWPPT